MPRTLLRRNLLDLRATISNSTSASLHTSRSSTRTRLAYRPFSSPPTNQATQQRHHRHYSTPTPQLTPSYHLRRTYSRNSLDARSRARSLERAQAQAHYPQRPPTRRCYASDSATADIQAPDHLSGAERSVFDKIKGELSPVRLEVQDISGGCGSMFGLDIVSPRFAGLTTIKQHQMVNRVLKEEIKGWHGMQLKTKAAE